MNPESYIDLKFPILRYHSPVKTETGVTTTIEPAWLDAPTSIWSSHDGSDTYRHGGRGLSRNFDCPSKKACLPGGVLDAIGRHYPILDIDAPEVPASGWKSFLDLPRLLLLGPHEYRFHFGKCEILDIESYKTKVIGLNKAEKHMYKFWRNVEKATTYRDILICIIPPVVYDHYYGDCMVRNWK